MSVKHKIIGGLTALGLIEVINEARGLATLLRPDVLLGNVRYRLQGAPEGVPIPPSRLIYLVAGTYSIEWFLGLGRLGAQSIRETLERNGVEISDCKAILDFGCGCGRVIRHFSDLEGVQVYGTDYNRRLIDWCGRRLTFAQFAVNGLSPPLSYPDHSLDLVYALSVFTHWGHDLQLSWIDEMRRIIRPGGHLLLTTHGESYLPGLIDEERAQFHAGELVVRRAHLAGKNICTAFCSPGYVREHLARGCELVTFVPQGAKGNPTQDLYLLRFSGA